MDNVEIAAQKLNEVYLGAAPIEPLRDQFDNPDPETAYAIQEINTKRWLAEGRKITGRKIGLTSKAVQEQLGVNQPDYGMLFNDMCAANGEEIDFASVCQARIEGEIAFVMGQGLDDEPISMAELVASIDYAVPAFEIVGSRIRDWDISIFDTIADNASSGKYVLGTDKKLLRDLDMSSCKMTLTQNGEVASTGEGAACLGNPLNAALWLAQKMVEAGRPLQSGDIVLSGALGPFVNVAPGAVYRVEISQLGSVRAAFRNGKS